MQEGLDRRVVWFFFSLIFVIGILAVWMYKPNYKRKSEYPFQVKTQQKDTFFLKQNECATISVGKETIVICNGK
jgi:hypothetical protein